MSCLKKAPMSYWSNLFPPNLSCFKKGNNHETPNPPVDRLRMFEYWLSR